MGERAGSTDLGPTDGEEGCQAQCHGAQSRNPRVASYQAHQAVSLCLTAAPRTAALRDALYAVDLVVNRLPIAITSR